jgi:hypothetical protein
MPKLTASGALEPEVMPLVLDRMDGSSFQVPPSNFRKWRFKLAVNASFEDWAERLQEAAVIRRGAQFFLARCLNHPQAATDEGQQAIATLQALPQYADLTDGTLANIKSIGARYTDEQWHQETLSWSHHAAVAYVKDANEREKLLKLAEEKNLTTQELREKAPKKRGKNGSRGTDRNSDNDGGNGVSAGLDNGATGGDSGATLEDFTDCWERVQRDYNRLGALTIDGIKNPKAFATVATQPLIDTLNEFKNIGERL